MILTASGRLKMVHKGTARTREWVSPLVQLEQGADSGTKLQTVMHCTHVPDGVKQSWAQLVQGSASIEMNATEVVCYESQGSIRMPVRRVGDLGGRVSWPWRAVNGNVPDAVYRGLRASGHVTFDVGQDIATIELDIPADSRWSAESVFFVALEAVDERHALQDGVRMFLGANRQTSIYTLNSDSFPANVFGKLASARKKDAEVGAYELAWKFIEHNFTQMPRQTRWGIGLALVTPVLHYLSQMNFILLVNCGLSAESPAAGCLVGGINVDSLLSGGGHLHPQTRVLVWVACVTVVLEVFEQAVDWLWRRLRLGGAAMLKLRAGIFTTMLQLTSGALDDFDDGEIQKTLDTQVQTAVASVWLQAFGLLRAYMSLVVRVVLVCQMLLERGLEGSSAVLLAIIPMMVLIAMAVFRFRKRVLLRLFYRSLEADEHWACLVGRSAAARPLLVGYRKSWLFAQDFISLHGVSNKAAYEAKCYGVHTYWMLRLLFLVIRMCVLVVGGRLVFNGRVSAGEFLVLLKAVQGCGKDLTVAAKINSKMMLGSEAVRKIANLLNAETSRWAGRKQRPVEEELLQQTSDPNIVLRGVSYVHPNAQLGHTLAISGLDLELPAGAVICFCDADDRKRFGTNTLFTVISGLLLPTSGEVLIRERWKVVYIPVMPILFEGTLMYNLNFGDDSVAEDTAWAVCRSLGISPGLIGRADFDVGPAGDYIKFSDRVVVCIARALLSDVDVLLLSSALDVLGQEHASQVIAYLKEFSQRHGLGHEDLPPQLRHRKTMVYRSKFPGLQDLAEYQIQSSALAPLRVEREEEEAPISSREKRCREQMEGESYVAV